MWHEGWGGRQGQMRETRPQDYHGESVAMLGYQRIGQDLSNVGSRMDREALHRILSNPKSVSSVNMMPAYRNLYVKNGDEWEPTSDAEALVDYLLSRKKDQPLPAELKVIFYCEIDMSSDPNSDQNLDYNSGKTSVVDMHDAVKRERVLMPAGKEQMGMLAMVLCAMILICGGIVLGNSNGFKDSIYAHDGYVPEPRPGEGGDAAAEDNSPWIDKWMKGGKKVLSKL